MKRVLIVASVASMIDQFNMENIKLLLSLGYKVEVAANFENPGNMSVQKKELLTAKLKQMRVKIHQIDFSRNMKQVKNHLIAYKQLKKVVADNKIDIIHCHSPIGGAISRLVGKTNNVKVIYTAHGFHFYKGAPKLNWLVYYPLEKYLSRFTDTILTINQEDYQIASQKFHSKKVYLINGVGIPIEKYKKIQINTMEKKAELGIKDKKTKIILSVGELNRNKNHAMVIEALKQFKDKNFKYFICGVGSLEYALKEKIKNSGLEEKVVLLGYHTDVLEIMKISDLFVFPSKREGLPVSVMEAMSVGLPIVASNIRGNMDLIQDNITGKLFDVNTLTGLTEILQLFFSGDMPLDVYSHNASMSIQNYSKEKVAHQIADIYEI
ncbi:glycosyltransferase family 4 protein [Enterococcus faecium]|nr:glycosyltransferase family 4 protein [Enterococcus faecium]MDB7515903.1 glycosyltransferase family 4 protein [Enterococcus faecium]